jgi:hypothetical protein
MVPTTLTSFLLGIISQESVPAVCCPHDGFGLRSWKLLARYNHGLLYSKTLSKWHNTLALTFSLPCIALYPPPGKNALVCIISFFWLEVLIGVHFRTDTGTPTLLSMDDKSDTSTRILPPIAPDGPTLTSYLASFPDDGH